MAGLGERYASPSLMSCEAVCASILKSSVNSLRAEVSCLTLENKALRERLLRAKLKVKRLRQAAKGAQGAAAAGFKLLEDLRAQAAEFISRNCTLEEALAQEQVKAQAAAEATRELRRKLSVLADNGQAEQLKATYLKRALERQKREKEKLRAEVSALKTVESQPSPPESQQPTAQKPAARTQRFTLPFNIVSQKVCPVPSLNEITAERASCWDPHAAEVSAVAATRLKGRVALLNDLQARSIELSAEELLGALSSVLRQTRL